MNDTSRIYEVVTEILRDVFEDEQLAASPELSARDVEGWDSLANVRVFLSVEQEFGVRFAASEIGAIDNVGDLVATIVKKKAKL